MTRVLRARWELNMIKKGKSNNRKLKDGVLQGFIYLSTSLTLAILAVIIGFILYKGLPGINVNFLTRQWDDKTTFVNVVKKAETAESQNPNYVTSLGITIEQLDGNIVIVKIAKDSPVKSALNMKNDSYTVKVQDIIGKAGDTKLTDMTVQEAVVALNQSTGAIRLKISRPGIGRAHV